MGMTLAEMRSGLELSEYRDEAASELAEARDAGRCMPLGTGGTGGRALDGGLLGAGYNV